MENVAVMVNPNDFGLEENKALELTSGLTTILTERETLKNAYLDVIELDLNEEHLKTFKELRLKIRDNRTKGIEPFRKSKKEIFLRAGQFIDAVCNGEALENERMETALLEKEKHFENLEKARLKAIHEERVSKLLPFNYEIGNVDFSGMDENMFSAILLGAETNHKAKLEAERVAEEQRLEAIRLEAEEKEKQRLEMERLRAENEAKEKQLKEEKAKADAELAEQKRLADIEAKKQAEIIAKQKTEADKLAAELKEKSDAELKEKQRLENEAKLKLEAEKKAAKAPIKTKLSVWVDSFSIAIPDSELLNNDIALEIKSKFEAFKNWSLTQINNI